MLIFILPITNNDIKQRTKNSKEFDKRKLYKRNSKGVDERKNDRLIKEEKSKIDIDKD